MRRSTVRTRPRACERSIPTHNERESAAEGICNKLLYQLTAVTVRNHQTLSLAVTRMRLAVTSFELVWQNSIKLTIHVLKRLLKNSFVLSELMFYWTDLLHVFQIQVEPIRL